MSEDSWSRPVDPRDVAIDDAISEIERELACRFSPVERIALSAVLWQFADRWPFARETPW